MGIVWEFYGDLGGGLPGGGHAPFFTCDGCGKKLDNGMGKVIWERRENPVFEEGEVFSTGRFWIFGKGAEHEACETDETRAQPWEDLDEFLLNIAHNSKLDLKRAEAEVSDRREKFGI